MRRNTSFRRQSAESPFEVFGELKSPQLDYLLSIPEAMEAIQESCIEGCTMQEFNLIIASWLKKLEMEI